MKYEYENVLVSALRSYYDVGLIAQMCPCRVLGFFKFYSFFFIIFFFAYIPASRPARLDEIRFF
jgi:hypothetical protein